MRVAVAAGAVPRAVLDADIAAFDFHHQHAVARMRDEEVDFTDGAQRACKPLDCVHHRERLWQLVECLIQREFGVACRVVGASATMHPAAIEPLQIADRQPFRAAVEFTDAKRGDAKRVVHAVIGMRLLFNEARLTEVNVAPRQPADQRELAAAHLLGFFLGDVEVPGQLEHQLGARVGVAVAEGGEEGEQEVVLGGYGHDLFFLAGIIIGCLFTQPLLHTLIVVVPQHDNGGASFGCQPGEGGIGLKLEVIVPGLLARVIKGGWISGCWIKCGHVRALKGVAVRAGEA